MAETRAAVKSTCPYCGVGCGVLIDVADQGIVGVRGDPDHPANFGKLCSKGSTLHLTALPPAQATGRALYPMQRRARGAPLARAAWGNTLNGLATRFAETIERYGPDSVAFYISGQLLTEDYYVFNKLAKALIGTNNVDTNSRLCMSSAVVGYKQALGADAPPCSYEDIERAHCVFIAGSNTAWAHPILYSRLEAARAKNPEMKVIVVDPRRTDTAREADLHLALLPGTDVALFHAMLHVLLWEGLIAHDFIAQHTEGFDALKDTVRDYTPKMAAQICGLHEEVIVQAARWFGRSKATLSLYCQGLNQSTSGTAKNTALINLHLATGQIGKPGAGPFSLTGQPNAMGGREVGGMANLLPAHRDLANPAHREEVARFWGVARVPDQPGKTAVEMFEAVRNGEIKALWIACTNPAQSMPDQPAVREALQRAELVVVQEAFLNTETVAYADVVLPATTWGEKEGTVTNSERRISRVRPALPTPGEARHDWAIAVDFAHRLEARLRPGQATLFPYENAESIFNEHRASTRGRDLDITGLSYALLDTDGPQQWPLPEGCKKGKARLYEDGVFATAGGRARFAHVTYTPTAERIDARHSVALTTGRLRDQWHGMSRTGTVAQLFSHAGEPRLALHPDELARRGLQTGDLVQVQSRRGSLLVMVEGDEDVRPGQAFLPMHWGSASLGGKGNLGINVLTTSAFDPVSKQPELKHAAVKITKAELPWRMVAFGHTLDADPLALREALRAHMDAFAFASCVLIGRDRPGVLLRAAATAPIDAEMLSDIDMLLDLHAQGVLRYDDVGRGIGRRVRVADGALGAVRLSGDTQAEPWLKEWWTRQEPVASYSRLLLLPSTQPPGNFMPRGKVVCNCWNVAETEILSAAASLQGPPQASLAALQDKLKCGTNCGSCVPELKRLIAVTRVAA